MNNDNHPFILFAKKKGYKNFNEFIASVLESSESYKKNLTHSDRLQLLIKNFYIIIHESRKISKILISLLSKKFPVYEILNLEEEVKSFNLKEKPKKNLKKHH